MLGGTGGHVTNLRLWLEKHFITLILAFTAGGFVFLLLELLLESHWEGTQLIAPIAAGLGLVLTLFSLAGRRGLAVVVMFLVLSVSGLFGTFQHFEERSEPREGPPNRATISAVQVADMEAPPAAAGPEGTFDGPPDGGRGGGGPPWLAPLSLSGLALLGAAATLAGGTRREAI